MTRGLGAALILMCLALLGSCPRPVVRAQTPAQRATAAQPGKDQRQPPAGGTPAAEVGDAGPVQPAPPAGNTAGSEPVGPAQAAGADPPLPAEPADTGPLPDNMGPAQDIAGAEPSGPQQLGPQPGPQPGDGVGGQAGPAGPQPPSGDQAPAAAAQPVGPQQQPPAAQYGALDAENFTGDAVRETPWGQSAPKLGQDALDFAGRWQVAVVYRAGETQLLADSDEWVIALDPDGRFYAKQQRGEQTWRQGGAWQLSGTKLVLNSGPGGLREFELSQELSNLCVLRDSAHDTALFCVRQSEGVAAPAVATKYDSDFGVLNLRPSGPGHWRAGYGEPPGTPLLAQLGGFLAGSWEQTPSRGFVLLELREGGFAGGWWYADSVAFDGRWFGVTAN